MPLHNLPIEDRIALFELKSPALRGFFYMDFFHARIPLLDIVLQLQFFAGAQDFDFRLP